VDLTCAKVGRDTEVLSMRAVYSNGSAILEVLLISKMSSVYILSTRDHCGRSGHHVHLWSVHIWENSSHCVVEGGRQQ